MTKRLAPERGGPLRVWEFRLLWGDQDIKVRAYFHEPRQRTDQTVVLLFHVKDTSLPTSEAIASAQNSFMERARCRLTTGQGNDWGLNWTRPFLGSGLTQLDSLL